MNIRKFSVTTNVSRTLIDTPLSMHFIPWTNYHVSLIITKWFQVIYEKYLI